MKILKKYSILLTLILAFSINVSAATKLTPLHIYKWAKNHNISRIHQFKKYINLHDQNQNTALCIAQKKKDKTTYDLLIKFGASTKVRCHNHNDPICNISTAGVVVSKSSIDYKKAGLVLLGGGVVAAALGGGGGGGGAKVCPEGYSTDYADIASCGTSGVGINGWIYEVNGNINGKACGKCTPKECETPSTTSPANTYKGLVLSSTIEHLFAGDDKCYIYEYECDNSQNHYASCDSFSNCSQKNIKVQNSNVEAVTCYVPEACPITDYKGESCPEGTFETSHCIDNSGRYNSCQCNETSHFANSDDCENAEINIGYNCKYDEETKCHVRFIEEDCPEGFSTDKQTVKECGTIGGWDLEKSGYSGNKECTKCKELTCNTDEGYHAGKTLAECGTTGANGYTIEQHPTDYAGDLPCNKCIENTCPSPSSTSLNHDANFADCDNTNASILKYIDLSTNGLGYAGELQCFTCSYECDNNQNSYATEPQCKGDGSRKCSKHEITLYGNQYTCYKVSGCTDDYEYENTCPEGMKSVGSCEFNGVVNHKCVCNTDDGYYEETNTCTTANPSYKCDQTNENKKCIYKGNSRECDKNDGYSTAYQSVDDCGTNGSSGWTYQDDNIGSGELKCGKCTALKCPEGYTSEEPKSYTGLKAVADHTHTSQFNGDNLCTLYNYFCDENQNYYPAGSNNCPAYASCKDKDITIINGEKTTNIECQVMNTCAIYGQENVVTDGNCPTGRETSETCQDNSGLHKKCLCNESTYFTLPENCTAANPGYECDIDPTSQCYVKKNECAEGYYSFESTCESENEGYECTDKDSEGCFKVDTNTCNEDYGYFLDPDKCQSGDNIEFTCTKDTQLTHCYVVTNTCNEDNGFLLLLVKTNLKKANLSTITPHPSAASGTVLKPHWLSSLSVTDLPCA